MTETISSLEPAAAVWKRVAGIEANDLPDGVALYDERTKTAHHLNAIAMLVWEVVDGRTTAEVTDAVGNALEVDPDEATQIAEAALGSLQAIGVIAAA